MNNYEYIIAGLPVLDRDDRKLDAAFADNLTDEIRSLVSKSDNALISKLLEGYETDNLTLDFYKEILKNHDHFIREFYRFDLNMRNSKVMYLNRRLNRPAEQDMIIFDSEAETPFIGEYEEKERVDSALDSGDILTRERQLDAVLWDKIEDILGMEVFSIDVILGFIAKSRIISRWVKLDPETGKELFKKLVAEVRGTYEGVNYTE